MILACSFWLCSSSSLTPEPGPLAYIGPGAGFALVGSFFAVFAAVFSAFVMLITWPIRLLARIPVSVGERLAEEPCEAGS